MKANLKKIALLFLLLAAGSRMSFAQCDKTVTLKSSKTSFLDAKGNIERSKDEAVVITISKTEITIVPGDEDHKAVGTITSRICDWATPFKDGKMIIKSKLSDPDGNEKNATITIIGKAGIVTLTFETEEMPGKKIQVVADKFE